MLTCKGATATAEGVFWMMWASRALEAGIGTSRHGDVHVEQKSAEWQLSNQKVGCRH